MAEKSKDMSCEEPKYNTCRHVQSVGQFAVYVTPGCPRAEMVKGHLISSKWRCGECRSWKPKK